MIKNSRGFSLVSTLVAAGIAGGIALVVAKLSGNLKDVELRSSGSMDARELLSEIKSILENEKNCKVSLRVSDTESLKFFKNDLDEPAKDPGLNVELWTADSSGTKRSQLKYKAGTKAGRVTLNSLKLFLDNGTGQNYPNGPGSDIGFVRVNYNADGGKKTLIRDYAVNVDYTTTPGGQSTITGCERSGVKALCESMGMNYNPENQRCLNPKDECDDWQILSEEGTWFGWKESSCERKAGGFIQSLILGQQRIAKTDSNSMKIKCCYSKIYEFVDCKTVEVAGESWWEGSKDGLCSEKPRGIIRKIEFYQGTDDSKDTNGMRILCCYPN